MRLIRYHCNALLTGVENGFLTTAPGAEVKTVEIGWHLYDHDTSNWYCNWEEVGRILEELGEGDVYQKLLSFAATSRKKVPHAV